VSICRGFPAVGTMEVLLCSTVSGPRTPIFTVCSPVTVRLEVDRCSEPVTYETS
jgi:hypothetical protein